VADCAVGPALLSPTGLSIAMDLPPSVHVPVLLERILEWLAPAPGRILVDGTLGGGGHTRVLAERVEPGGFVVALDRDPAAVTRAEHTLRGLPIKVAAVSYTELADVLAEIGVAAVDGILLDLGLSSDQLADPERGFSFNAEGPLDLRFDPSEGQPAWKLLEQIEERALANLIYEFGEERYSRRIARAIVERRADDPVRAARDLAELVRRAIPRGKSPERIDPATRTFQALRIAVNHELEALAAALERFPAVLRPGGRVAVISFHSLEDRIVKQAFRDNPSYEPLTKRPILPSDREIAANPRARSAKLRVAQRRS